MILIRLALFLGVLLAVTTRAGEFGSYKCMGGDGPNPLTDLTELYKPAFTTFDLKGAAQEFLVWEKKDQIVYRNQFGNIYLLNLSTGESLPFGSSSAPLSKVKDLKERFVTLAGTPITLDTAFNPPQWQKWAHKNRVKHLYWHSFFNRESLFSVGSSFARPNKQRIEVYSFSRKGIKPHICNLFSGGGAYFHLGEGHVYPYVFLYQTRKESQKTRLTYFNIQLEGEVAGLPMCRLYQAGQYSRLIPGNVKEVYQFPGLMVNNRNMFVVLTDHPEKNLLWDDGVYGCRYYHFESREPMVLNSRQAVLAVWSERRGLSLVYPRRIEGGEPVVLRPLKNQIAGPINRQHLALSDDGKTLYVLAKMKGSKEKDDRKLIQVKLE